MTHRHTQNLYNRLLELQAELDPPSPCTDKGNLFFPEDCGDPDLADLNTAIAKALCRECPIMKHCRDYGIQAQKQFGIYGGVTSAERRGNG